MDKAWGKLTPQLRNMFTLGKSHTVGMLASRGNFPRLRLGNQCRLACGRPWIGKNKNGGFPRPFHLLNAQLCQELYQLTYDHHELS